MPLKHIGEPQLLQPILGFRRLRKLLERRYKIPILVERSDDFGELLRIGKLLVAVQNVDDKLSIIMFDGGGATETYVSLDLGGLNAAIDHIMAVIARNAGRL